MKNRFSIRSVGCIVLLIMVIICEAVSASTPEYSSFEELNGKTVAMLTGAPFEELIKEKVPDVGGFAYFNSTSDMSLAIKQGKIDAFLNNNAVASLMANKDDALCMFPESLAESTFGIAFAKGDKDRDLWQEAYNKISDEQKEELWNKWTGSDESKKILMNQDWEGKNGTVKVAACDTLAPMSYVGEDGEIIGFDVEMVLLMAKELDIKVEFTGMEFAAILNSVASGKAKMGIGSIIATDERKESVDFIEYYPAAFVLVVRASDYKIEKQSFTEKIKSSFNKTFIRDNRYKMIISGFGYTVLIAVVSGIIGLILGFVLVFLRWIDNRIINAIIKIYSILVAGIPAVVILMVFYYVIFGKTDTSAVIVAIVGFALIFAARCYGVIWNAISCVDKGQMEAALALGYSRNKAFKSIILPQSRKAYFPVIQSQFVMLVKETSIAGYISVVELTRAGDLIRSRTMEAFFPLFTVALIYFIVIYSLTKCIDLIDLWFEQKKNSRKIKGVD